MFPYFFFISYLTLPIVNRFSIVFLIILSKLAISTLFFTTLLILFKENISNLLNKLLFYKISKILW